MGSRWMACAAAGLTVLVLHSSAAFADKSPECASGADCKMGGIEEHQCLPVHGVPAAAPSGDASSPFDAGFACSCVSGKCKWVANQAEHEAIRAAVKAYAGDKLPSFSPKIADHIQIRSIEEPFARAYMTYGCGYNCLSVCDFQLRENTGNWMVDPAASRCNQTQTTFPSYSVERFNQGKMTTPANYGVTGYVVGKSECPPCPKGVLCETCLQDHIVISDNPTREPLTESRITGHEMVVFTDKPSAFTVGEKYDFSIRLTQPADFTGKYMGSYASHVLLLGFKPVDSPQKPGIAIDEADQACRTDADCGEVQATCSGCSCNEPVNVRYKADYVRKLHEHCDSLRLPQCDYSCRTPYPRCVNHRCAMSSSPAPR